MREHTHSAATHRQHSDHAVVFGAGVAGLLAAAVLSPRFSQVTVFERDRGVDSVTPRKGTPQAAHIHLLLIQGAHAIDRIVPRIFEEISACGGLNADSTRDLAFFHFGRWQPRGWSGLPARLQTRPFLEWHIARRVRELPNVRILYGHEAGKPRLSNGRVAAVQATNLETRKCIEIPTSLVVDAAGRGSLTPRWLRSLGYPTPRTSKVELQITYASRLFKAPPTAQEEDWRAMLIYPEAPHEYRGGALYFQEGDRWIVTMASYRGEQPPANDSEFTEFAKTLPSDEIYRQIQDAEPASPISVYRYPGALRRHYESLRSRPRGLVAIGDAVCSFNPVFGQGMTAAALQACELARVLDGGRAADIEQSFASAAARVCDAPWLLSTAMDLRYPHAVGARPFWHPLLDAYLRRFFRATANDYASLLDLMRVLHLDAPPTRLARPRNVFEVLRNLAASNSSRQHQRPPLESYSYSGRSKRYAPACRVHGDERQRSQGESRAEIADGGRPGDC